MAPSHDGPPSGHRRAQALDRYLRPLHPRAGRAHPGPGRAQVRGRHRHLRRLRPGREPDGSAPRPRGRRQGYAGRDPRPEQPALPGRARRGREARRHRRAHQHARHGRGADARARRVGRGERRLGRGGPAAPEPDIPDVRGGDVFLYIYTSGTTGYPKPAIVRHLRFTMGGITLAGLLGVEAGETIYAPLPLYHGESLFVGFAPAFRAGGAFASRRRFSASAFLDDVRRHQAVAFVYVGELCRYLLRLPPTPRDRDHRLRVAAGAGLRPDIWTAFQARFGIARIIEMYGATEGNVALHNADGRVGSVGKPHPMLEDTVRLGRFDLARGELLRGPDGFCIPCAPGEPGELLGRVGGAMEYDGYTDRAASERKLVRDAFARGDAWFRTGDLLRQDADGYYYFVDRIGDTFRWKGENVATQEVADVLCGAPGVTEANVYGVAVPGEDGRAGMAALVLAEGARFDGAALYARTEQHLPAYARPAFVRLVPEMDVP